MCLALRLTGQLVAHDGLALALSISVDQCYGDPLCECTYFREFAIRQLDP